MDDDKLRQSFPEAMYRYIDGANVAVIADFGATGLRLVTSMGQAYLNEKERSKATFARAHSDWLAEQKRNFNDAWANRDSFGPGGPHCPGSPKVFKGF